MTTIKEFIETASPHIYRGGAENKISGYYLGYCPVCGMKEAYIYADEVEKQQNNHAFKVVCRCNRLNNCGANTTLEYSDEASKMPIVEPKTKEKMSAKGKTVLDYNTNQGLIGQCYSQQAWKESYRHISVATLNKYVLKYHFIDLMKNFENEFDTSLKSPLYQARDIIIPINNIEGKTERLILRSTTNDMGKKELNTPLVAKGSEIWNCEVLKSCPKIVFVTEGIFDALSLLDVRGKEDYEAISLTGVGKYNHLIRVIDSNKFDFSNTCVIIAFDNDEAGNKYAEKLRAKLDERSIRNKRFITSKKDVNEFYQAYGSASLKLKINNILKD